MHSFGRIFRALCACILVFASFPPSFAQNPPVSASSPDAGGAARAQALLDRAVLHYQQNGEKALAAFSRVGEFIKDDLYVYVLSTKGILLASGGPSVVLVGRDIREVKDPEGKLFIKEMMEIAKAKGGGAVEYRWLNREHQAVERKVVYFKQTGDVVVAVGNYIPRASAQQAQALLTKAAETLKQDDKAAFERFNNLNGGFVQDDLYVFVVGMKDMVMYAHGAMPRLVNRNVKDLKDANGKLIIQEMVRVARAKGKGELKYTWLNPVTRLKEPKTSYLQRVGDYVVVVGYYQR